MKVTFYLLVILLFLHHCRAVLVSQAPAAQICDKVTAGMHAL